LPFLGYTQLFEILVRSVDGQIVPIASVGAAAPWRPYFLHHSRCAECSLLIFACKKQHKICMSDFTQNVFCTMLATNLNSIAMKKRFRSECEKFLKKTSSRMLPAV